MSATPRLLARKLAQLQRRWRKQLLQRLNVSRLRKRVRLRKFEGGRSSNCAGATNQSENGNPTDNAQKQATLLCCEDCQQVVPRVVDRRCELCNSALAGEALARQLQVVVPAYRKYLENPGKSAEEWMGQNSMKVPCTTCALVGLPKCGKSTLINHRCLGETSSPCAESHQSSLSLHGPCSAARSQSSPAQVRAPRLQVANAREPQSRGLVAFATVLGENR